jgi:plasmid stabilization system protein ParE
MKVFFEPAARDELEAIYRWLARENPREPPAS